MKKLILSLGVICSFLVFSSCQDEENTVTNTNIVSSPSATFMIEEGVSASEMVISDIYNLVQLALDDQSIFYPNAQTTPIITKEKLSPSQMGDFPMILTIDFTTDTLSNFDNRFRCGKIVAHVSAPWRDSLSVINAELQNYYLSTRTPYYQDSQRLFSIAQCNSNMKVKILNKGLTYFDDQFIKTLYITTDSAKVSNKYGSVEMKTSRYSYYYQGFETPTHLDDKLRNVHYSSGTATDNKTNWIWSATVPTNLDDGIPYFAYNRDCPWLISGSILLNYEYVSSGQKRKSVITFGPSNQSSKDNNASFNYNGTSIVIALP